MKKHIVFFSALAVRSIAQVATITVSTDDSGAGGTGPKTEVFVKQ